MRVPSHLVLFTKEEATISEMSETPVVDIQGHILCVQLNVSVAFLGALGKVLFKICHISL